MSGRQCCPQRRRLVLALGLAPLAGSLRAQDAPAVAAAPPAAFHAQDLDWHDAARQRAVPVRLYRPALPVQRAMPLLVFSHGIGGSRLGYSYLGQHFASQGWASLHLQHVGSDRQVWAGNPFQVVGRLQAAAQEAEAVARVQDLHFALDTLLASPLGEAVDPRRIAAAGHSYGANTTLLAVGARVQREGAWRDYRDPRVKAAIVLSAPPFYGEASAQDILSPIQLPSLHITTREDVIRIPGYYSGVEDRLAVYQAMGGAHKALAVFKQGSHSVFTDRVHNPALKHATQALVMAFLQQAFEGQSAPLAAWPQQYAALLASYSQSGLAGLA